MSSDPLSSRDRFYNASADPICQLLWVKQAGIDQLYSESSQDWIDIAMEAIGLGIGPLVYFRLRELGISNRIPAEALRMLKTNYLSSVASSMVRRHELKRILCALNEASIQVIILKGAHLAETVYPDPGLRPMCDLDLLVRLDMLDHTVEVLKTLGYEPERQYWTDFETTVQQHLPPFINPRGQMVELHWTILHPFFERSIDINAVWERAVEFDFEGGTARGLSPEDLLLQLTVHAAIQHQLKGGPRTVYDIAAAVNRWEAEIDWSLLASMSRERKAQNALYLLMLLSQELFDAPVPEGFLLNNRPVDFDPQWKQAAVDLLFLNQNRQPPLSINYAAVMNARSLPGKAIELLKQIFISPEKITQVYGVKPGSARVWLYYPVRLKYLVTKHAGSMNRLLAGDTATRQSAELTSLMKKRMDYLEKVFSEG